MPLGGVQAKGEALRVQRTKEINGAGKNKAWPCCGERSKNGDSGRRSPGLCPIPPIHSKAKVVLQKDAFMESRGEHKEDKPLGQKETKKERSITANQLSGCHL